MNEMNEKKKKKKKTFLYRLLLETILQSFSFIPQTASEDLIFEYFFKQILPFDCHGNQPN